MKNSLLPKGAVLFISIKYHVQSPVQTYTQTHSHAHTHTHIHTSSLLVCLLYAGNCSLEWHTHTQAHWPAKSKCYQHQQKLTLIKIIWITISTEEPDRTVTSVTSITPLPTWTKHVMWIHGNGSIGQPGPLNRTGDRFAKRGGVQVYLFSILGPYQFYFPLLIWPTLAHSLEKDRWQQLDR